MPEPKPIARHYPALDGLRGMAALMIVWRHFLQLTPAHGRVMSFVTQFFDFTWIGVDLFFVLSGFLITGILADAKSGKHFFRTFYGRRVLRIFPLYYGLLVVVLIVFPSFGISNGVSPESKIYLWTYTSNLYFTNGGWLANHLTHLWSLAIEEQYYLVWPLVIFLVRDLDRLRTGLRWAFLAVLVLRLVLFLDGYNSIWLYLNTLTHCDGLLLGSYLALAVRSNDPKALRGLRPRASIVIGLVLFTLLCGTQTGLFPVWEARPEMVLFRAVATLSLLAILFVWLIHAATVRESGHIYRFFSHRWMRWFGTYSYGLYVLHVPLAFLVLRGFNLDALPPSRIVLAEAGLCVLYFGTCIGAAFLSWHLYEKHFLKLKRYLPYDSAKPAAVEASLQEDTTATRAFSL